MSYTPRDSQEEPVSLTGGADLLACVAGLAAAREQIVVDLVDRLAQLNRAGVTERLEGLPLDVHLADAFRWNRAEVSMLLDAGDVLSAMPATMTYWRNGLLSWSIIRDLVGRVRSLGRDNRALVDARFAASAELMADMDADRIGWAIDEAVDAVRGATVKERAEKAADRDSFFAMQMKLEGGSSVYSELDALDTAIVAGALDRKAALAKAARASSGARDGANVGSSGRRTLAKGRAAALVGLCADSLGGHSCHNDPESDDGDLDDFDGGDFRHDPEQDHVGHEDVGPDGFASGDHDRQPCSADDRRAHRLHSCISRPAKPLFIVHVPIDRIEQTSAGLLEVAIPGYLPTLSARLVDSLAADADVRAVLFDGKRPLMVTRKLTAKQIPTDTRIAVNARDLGARDPAGRTPIGLSHIHHLKPGVHDPDWMVTTSNRGHLRIIHRHGWSGRVDVDTAAVTWTRGNRTIRTLPWGTPLNRPHHPPTRQPARQQTRQVERPPLPEPPD